MGLRCGATGSVDRNIPVSVSRGHDDEYTTHDRRVAQNLQQRPGIRHADRPRSTDTRSDHRRRVQPDDQVLYRSSDTGHAQPSEVGGRHPTLYLLSREGSGTSRVLVAALVDRVFEVAGLAATARGGRVDPPITVMLDEAANVCRIDALPDLYSFFGSQGISVTTILQSYKQGVRVWGKDGMDALWSAATVAIAGAGLKDMEFCKTLSDLVGQHEVDKRSHSSSNTGSSHSTSTHWEPIMRPEEVAALPKTKALLFSSGASPVTLTLKPWYAERDADQITD